jgi:benzil reductase ((S)-benzoin forming)
VVSLSRQPLSSRNNRQNIRIDLNDTGASARHFKRIRSRRRRTGRLSPYVLINNAGVLEPIAPIGDCDDALLARNIQVNLTAPLIPHGIFSIQPPVSRPYKWIVNITSGASRSPYYGWSAYGAAKAGLDMATRAMAVEFSRIDPAFRACAVAPGTVDTGHAGEDSCCTAEQFEQVDKFLGLKASGALHPPIAWHRP